MSDLLFLPLTMTKIRQINGFSKLPFSDKKHSFQKCSFLPIKKCKKN